MSIFWVILSKRRKLNERDRGISSAIENDVNWPSCVDDRENDVGK